MCQGPQEELELGAFKFVKFSIGRKMYMNYNHNHAPPMISFTEHPKYHLLYFIIYQGAGTCSTPYRLNLSHQALEAGEHQPTGEGRAELTEVPLPGCSAAETGFPHLLPSPAHSLSTSLPSRLPYPGACLPLFSPLLPEYSLQDSGLHLSFLLLCHQKALFIRKKK